MNTRHLSKKILFLLFYPLAVGVAAQELRTYVAARGNDSNACQSEAAPCRSLQRALAQTAPGGSVVIVDSGIFTGATIDKSITISAAKGVSAAILTIDQPAFLIAGDGIRVILRDLTLDGLGYARVGIDYRNGARLQIENCTIHGFTAFGVYALSSGNHLHIEGGSISDSGEGIRVLGNADGKPQVLLRTVRLENNYTGFWIGGGATGSATGIVAVDNLFTGIEAAAGFGPGTKLVVEQSLISGNQIGIYAFAPLPDEEFKTVQVTAIGNVISNNQLQGIRIRAGIFSNFSVANSTVSGNGIGLEQEGNAKLFSYGNNRSMNNVTETRGVITPRGHI